jgi:formylglycine-generating enzyme required for sulfatase activity
MGMFEVTQAQYEEVMGNNPSYFNKDKGGGPDHPVETVSWDEAMKFCKKLSERPEEKANKRVYTLPTEAQWEYACRGGPLATEDPFHYGKSLSSAKANFYGQFPYGGAAEGPYLASTTDVGSYKPNALGLYDMHGNVWEWCLDSFDEDYFKNSPSKDPYNKQRSGNRRVLRGGSWSEIGRSCRSACRTGSTPAYRHPDSGFRVVLLVASKTP